MGGRIVDPNYRGVKCKGCGKRVSFLLTDICASCTHERDKSTIERLQKANTDLMYEILDAKEEVFIENYELVRENERLRAALERIANNEDCQYASCGVTAREALHDD